MSAKTLPMTRGKRGPVDTKSSRPGKPIAKSAPGTEEGSIHPMTKRTGNVAMNRVLKGVDKRKSPKGVQVPSKSRQGLAGMYF